MTRDEYLENNELFVYPGLEDALVGIAQRCGQPDLAVYDEEKVVEILMASGASFKEAHEHIQHNILGGWNGDHTPVILSRFTP